MYKLKTIEGFARAVGRLNMRWVVGEEGLRGYSLIREARRELDYCPLTAFCYFKRDDQAAHRPTSLAPKYFLAKGSELEEAMWSIMRVADSWGEFDMANATPTEQKVYKALQKQLNINEEGSANENV